ncbi:MAG: trehalose-phosphatase [Planctomycetota bacterium]|jgi:trehalose-phosphatase
MSGLDQTLNTIATVPVLLVASDFDGTVAPIVRDPAKAKPRRESTAALRTLCTLPRTHVAVISGRAREELARLSGLPADVHLVGSHGSEFDADFAETLPPEAARLRDRLIEELAAVAAGGSGFAIETKPAGVALHYRNANGQEAEQAVRTVLRGPGSIQGVYTKQGKKVLELGVVATSKGDALERIRHLCGASAVIFFGDDTTDEDAFATLTGPDVGVKVGRGRTRAAHRVGGPRQVAQALARLSELRAAWLAGAEAAPPD